MVHQGQGVSTTPDPRHDNQEPGSASDHGDPARAQPAPSIPHPVRRRRPILLAAVLLGPLAVLAGLMWAIAYSLAHDPGLTDPPKGAGAGETGGANALGEWLSHR